MGLDMDLYIVKKYDVKAHKEIVTKNLNKFKYDNAVHALSGDIDSSARFMSAADQYFDFGQIENLAGLSILTDTWKEVLIDGPSAHPEDTRTYESNMFKGHRYTLNLHEEYQKHIQNMKDFVQWYEETEHPPLSKEAQALIKELPAVENTGNFHPDIHLTEEEKEQLGKYNLYWRKVNHIHNWFVTHVQDKSDDQEEYPVLKEDLIALRDTLQKVVDLYQSASFDYQGQITTPEVLEQLEKHLPTQGGFFFGNTSYSQSYYEYNESTLKSIKEILDEVDFDQYMFLYSASW